MCLLLTPGHMLDIQLKRRKTRQSVSNINSRNQLELCLIFPLPFAEEFDFYLFYICLRLCTFDGLQLEHILVHFISSRAGLLGELGTNRSGW